MYTTIPVETLQTLWEETVELNRLAFESIYRRRTPESDSTEDNGTTPPVDSQPSASMDVTAGADLVGAFESHPKETVLQSFNAPSKTDTVTGIITDSLETGADGTSNPQTDETVATSLGSENVAMAGHF